MIVMHYMLMLFVVKNFGDIYLQYLFLLMSKL